MPPETPTKSDKPGLRAEVWIFGGTAAFFIVATVIYGSFTGKTEPAGTVALGLTAGLLLIIGSFLWFASRRLEGPRPEDDPVAEVSDGAGDVGFFAPASYWPFGLALAAAFTAYAVAFWLVWMLILGIGFLLMTLCGLLFEFQRRYSSH